MGKFKRSLCTNPNQSVLITLGILFGVIMPMVSAFIYPTYTNLMPQPWLETTRLLEFPFVAAELLVIVWVMLYSLLFQSLFEGMLHYPRFIIAIMILFVITISGRDQPNIEGAPSASS